jgi:ribosomal protein S18 acetylase RimI-like enzyme
VAKAAGAVIILLRQKRLNGNDMANIEYIETDRQGLDLIVPLWQKLNEHHRLRSLYFPGHYTRMTWDLRKKQLIDKSRNGSIRIDLAKDGNTEALIGYCVSTISEKRQGEIDSIYIEDGYRRHGIGDNLMKKALKWMDEHSVKGKMLEVASGNEEVFAFYSRYDFYPRSTIMRQVETKVANSSHHKSGSE